MRPSKLYSRDYTVLNEDEKNQKEAFIHQANRVDILNLEPRITPSIAMRRNMSLFPNNHIELSALKEESNIGQLNNDFLELINGEGCLERDVLNFINHRPAYHIVGSILSNRFPFGHHDLYLFKEMWLGTQYRTDYVLVGSSSGGYEFVLIEFEKPDGRITLRNGHFGEAFRNGQYQVEDWKRWLDAHFVEFANDLASVKGESELPIEFREYDSTRFHYVVVAGRRDDFNDQTYWNARDDRNFKNLYKLHHDNLYDSSVLLETAVTF